MHYIVVYIDKGVHDVVFLSIEKIENWAKEYWSGYEVNIFTKTIDDKKHGYGWIETLLKENGTLMLRKIVARIYPVTIQ